MSRTLAIKQKKLLSNSAGSPLWEHSLTGWRGHDV